MTEPTHSADYGTLLVDLMERLVNAQGNLLRLAADTDNASELLRLEAKASGVRLAMGYLRELVTEMNAPHSDGTESAT